MMNMSFHVIMSCHIVILCHVAMSRLTLVALHMLFVFPFFISLIISLTCKVLQIVRDIWQDFICSRYSTLIRQQIISTAMKWLASGALAAKNQQLQY